MSNIFKKTSNTLLAFLMSIGAAIAQEGEKLNVDISTSTESTTWYTQPWVWIVAAAVFLLLLVALLRGGGNKS